MIDTDTAMMLPVSNSVQLMTPQLITPVETNVGVSCYIAPSQMPNSGLGLFAAEDIPARSIIGFYTGDSVSTSQLKDELRNRYAINVTSALAVSPPVSAHEERPDIVKYPLSIANEASKGFKNNAVMRIFTTVKDEPIVASKFVDSFIVKKEEQPLYLVALISACHIPAGHEILWYYGDSYRKHRIECKYKPAPAATLTPNQAYAIFENYKRFLINTEQTLFEELIHACERKGIASTAKGGAVHQARSKRKRTFSDSYDER